MGSALTAPPGRWVESIHSEHVRVTVEYSRGSSTGSEICCARSKMIKELKMMNVVMELCFSVWKKLVDRDGQSVERLVFFRPWCMNSQGPLSSICPATGKEERD